MLLVLAAVGDQGASAACAPPRGGFKVYQALLYEHMPDLRARGLARIHVIDRGFWRTGNGPGSVADPAKVTAVIAALPHDTEPVVIDIEWPGLHVRDAATVEQIGALAGIAAQFKAAAPHRKVGYYGVFPLDDYWRALDVPPGGVAEWHRDNDAAAPINAHVDVTFPSLYTYYEDRAGWVRQANALVCEARRISGKPVYAFIWPEYHISSPRAGHDLPPDYWQLQLETLHRIADGIVIWGGYDMQASHPREWDEKAPWWRVTQMMMVKWRLASSSTAGASREKAVP